MGAASLFPDLGNCCLCLGMGRAVFGIGASLPVRPHRVAVWIEWASLMAFRSSLVKLHGPRVPIGIGFPCRKFVLLLQGLSTTASCQECCHAPLMCNKKKKKKKKKKVLALIPLL